MNNFEQLSNFNWEQNWAGNFGFIIPSIMSWQYTHMLHDTFGVGLYNIVITNKRGYTTCFFDKNELNAFGDSLAERVRNGEYNISERSQMLKTTTDIFNVICARADNEMNYELFIEFRDALNNYADAHRFVKVVVDHLTPKELEEYLEQLQEARLYSEPVYDEARIFSEKLARYIVDKSGYSYDATRGLTETEIVNFFKTDELPDESLLKERFNQCILSYFNDDEEITLDNYEQYESILTGHSADSTKITGQVAYPGLVIGTVRIIWNPKEYIEFNEGDILVTGMTRPDFLPLMNKAAAFVTDAGGVLCHAAIVARETQKPAVIGTQTATKILKDGDLVEVDANNGVVRIFKQKNTVMDILLYDWEFYLSRPFNLFTSSIWFTWYNSKKAQEITGVKISHGLFVQEYDGLLQHYQVKSDKSKLEESYTKIIKTNISLAINLVKRGEELNAEVKDRLKKPIRNLTEELDFLSDLAWHAAIFPAFFIQACEYEEIENKELIDISERLRHISLYPQIMKRILDYVQGELSRIGIDNPEQALEKITLQDFLTKDANLMKKKIASAEGQFTLFSYEGGEKVLWSDGSKKIFDHLNKEDMSDEITGDIAYKGKVQGIARVVRDFTKQSNIEFNKGDILVSVNSNPSMMNLINKSAALITDEGGIICHAAIVSRELEIPSIIGVKNGTKKIQTGDLIEVDANNGVVTIIKKISNLNS